MSKILKEDIWATRGENFTFHDTVNAAGSHKSVDKDTIVFRRPTTQELKKAFEEYGIRVSEYEMEKVRIFSQVLYDFELVDKLYRSKKEKSYSNKDEIDKAKSIFKNFLHSFKENEPVENVRTALNVVKNDSMTVNDIVGVLDSTNDWKSEDELLKNIASYYNLIKEYDSTDDIPEADLRRVRTIFGRLVNFVEKESDIGNTKDEIKNALIYANTVNDYIERKPYMRDAATLVYGDSSVKNVSDLEVQINEYLDSQVAEKTGGHANQLLHQDALRNLQKLAQEMKNDGFDEGGFTTYNFFGYLNSNKPELIDYLSSTYKTKDTDDEDDGEEEDDYEEKAPRRHYDDDDEIRWDGETFPTWESLAQFLYSPVNIKNLHNRVGVELRSKVGGGIAQGAELNVDLRLLQQQINNKQNRIENYDYEGYHEDLIEANQKKLEDRQAEYEKEKAKQKRTKEKIKELKNNKNISETKRNELISRLEEVVNIRKKILVKLTQQVATQKNLIKRYTARKESGAAEAAKEQDLKDKQKLLNRKEEIINKFQDTLGDNDDTREVNSIIKNVTKKDRETGVDGGEYDPSNTGMHSISFAIDTTDEDFIQELISRYERMLGVITTDDEDRELPDSEKERRWAPYAAIGSYDVEFPDEDGDVIDATQIYIDYPEECKLYKTLVSREKEGTELNLVMSLIGKGLNKTNAKLGTDVTVLGDTDDLEINVSANANSKKTKTSWDLAEMLETL